MHEFDYFKHEKRDKEFVQEQLQIEAPLPPKHEKEKKGDRHEERGVEVIDVWQWQ